MVRRVEGVRCGGSIAVMCLHHRSRSGLVSSYLTLIKPLMINSECLSSGHSLAPSLTRSLPPSDFAHLPQHHDVTISPDTANYLTGELIVRLARLSVPVEVINLTTGGPSMQSLCYEHVWGVRDSSSSRFHVS